MKIDQKQLKKLLPAMIIVGRLRELDRDAPYIPYSRVSTRRRSLKRKLVELTNEVKSEEKNAEVHIRIQTDEGTKTIKKDDKKSLTFKLKEFFNKSDDDNDVEISNVISGLFEEDNFGRSGKIVTEL